jgi:flagellar assembly protein FliH
MMIMSDPARSVSLAALGRGDGGFARDARYMPVGERGEAAAPAFDPVADAYARGYAEGAQAASDAAQADAARTDAARHRIETALAAMDSDATDQFAQALKDTVLALCHTVLAEAALAPDALARRVGVAAAMFARADDERVIRLHPEDLALVHGRLPDAWHCEPDPAMERGAVRIETGGGGVEDGPAQWRAALAEALR